MRPLTAVAVSASRVPLFSSLSKRPWKIAPCAASNDGAEILVVLDLRDQRLAGLLLATGDRRQMRIDGVGLGQERGPEIGLRLIVLELRDGAGQTARHFGEAADMPGIAVAARRHVQVGVVLHDIDDVEQIVRGAAQRGCTAGRLRVVIFVELEVDLVQHRLQVDRGQRRGIGRFAGFDLRQLRRIVQDLGQTLLNRGEVGRDLGEIPRIDAAGGNGRGCVEDLADRFQAGARRCRSECCRIIGACRNVLERDVVGARIGQERERC